MRSLRAVDFPAYPADRYGAQFLSSGESALVIAANVPAGAAAPARHVHAVDQLYYVLRGVMHVALGEQVHLAGPQTLVYIPAGTPHHNWNEGDEDEFHFEVLAPAPRPGEPLFARTQQTDLGGRRPLVVAAAGAADAHGGALLGREDGSAEFSLDMVALEPGAPGSPLHVHPFDQWYFVVEGELVVQVGLELVTVGAYELVVLPAGVAHTARNETAAPERHLSLSAPAPGNGAGEDAVAVVLARAPG